MKWIRQSSFTISNAFTSWEHPPFDICLALIPKILFAHPPKTLHLKIQLTTVQGTGQVRCSHSLTLLLLVRPEASVDWVPIARRPWTPGGKDGETTSPFWPLNLSFSSKAAQMQESCFTLAFPKAQNKEVCASGSFQTKNIYRSADCKQGKRQATRGINTERRKHCTSDKRKKQYISDTVTAQERPEQTE